MSGNKYVLLIIILIIGVLSSSSVYAGNLTGSWQGSITGSGTGATITSTAGNIGVTGKITTTGNARWGIADPGTAGSVGFSNGLFNINNFWSNSNAAGHRSLQSNYWWDITPNAPTTDIDRAGDDKGTGTITFYFSKPVLNPVLHIDRLGGDWHVSSNYIISNSALWTLINSDLTLTKLTGNNQFQVTSKTMRRTPDRVFSSITQESTWGSNSAAAGSVRINGIVKNVTFRWTGAGIESVGHDGVELMWDLTDDRTSPTINADVTPNLTKTGSKITINATADSDTKNITVSILGKTYSMVKGTGNVWRLNYTIPSAADGFYDIILTATDLIGNKGTYNLKFTVDNTPPTINSNVTPNLTKSGNNITIKATADSDTVSLTVNMLGTVYNMIKGANGIWTLNYNVPQVLNGIYYIFLTATDHIGNQKINYTQFKVDNTPPTISGNVTSSITKSNKTININVTADSDAQNVTATILGVNYNLVKGNNNTWTLQYDVPDVLDAIYDIFLSAIDTVGNMGNSTLKFTVDNIPPMINATITPNLTRSENTLIIRASADPDTKNVTANIDGTVYNMLKDADGTWILQYTVPQGPDGFSLVSLTATDFAGNHGNNSTGFTVDNTLPSINAVTTPNMVKTGDKVTIKVNSDPGVTGVTADILGNTFNLTRDATGTWLLQYTVPGTLDGFKTVLLTVIDSAGNRVTGSTGFNVDNTPPKIKATVTPGLSRTGYNIALKATADPDTEVLTAKIMGKTYNLVKGSDGTWLIHYTVPHVSNGKYEVILTAVDGLGNQGNASVDFTVYSIPPSVYSSGNNSTGNIAPGTCGPSALSTIFAQIGIGAGIGDIATLAGTTSDGTSFYGMVQAANILGLNLTGLKLDVDQLKPLDIVLLNLNGNGHYSIILSVTDDQVSLLDPAFGIITLSKEDFLKLYTGYALTLDPDGRGILLTDDQMKSLFGSTDIATLFEGWLAAEGASFEIPGPGWLIAALLLVGGTVFFGGNYLLDKYAPDLIPHKGTGLKGLGIDLFNTLSPVVKLNQDGTYYTGFELPGLINWAAYRKPENPYESPNFRDPNEGKNMGTFAGELWSACDKIPIPLNYGCKGVAISFVPAGILAATLVKLGFTPDKIVNLIINGPNQLWKWLTGSNDYKTTGDYTINDSMNISSLFNITLNNTSKITAGNSGLMMVNIPGLINGAMNSVSELSKWIGDNVSKVNGLVNSGIKSVVDGVKSAGNAVKTAVSTLASTVKAGVQKAVTAVKRVATKVVDTAKKVASKVVTTAKKIVNKAVTVVKKAVKTVKKVVKKVIKKVVKTVRKVVKTVKKVVKKVVNAVNHAVNTVKSAVSSGWNWLKGKIGW